MQLYRYGANDRQVVGAYTPKIDSKHGLVFIHGGLWRFPNNTYHDWEHIIDRITESGDIDFKIYSVDYRLSPDIEHPLHLVDVVKAIELICQQDGITEISICGHSCGATIATQLMTLEYWNMRPLKVKFKSIFLLDGIYNVKSFVEEYPEYKQYILEAFSNHEICNFMNFKSDINDKIKELENLIIVQSTRDELVSFKQSLELLKWLNDEKIINYKLIIENLGLHDQVYINDKIAELILTSLS